MLGVGEVEEWLVFIAFNHSTISEESELNTLEYSLTLLANNHLFACNKTSVTSGIVGKKQLTFWSKLPLVIIPQASDAGALRIPHRGAGKALARTSKLCTSIVLHRRIIAVVLEMKAVDVVEEELEL